MKSTTRSITFSLMSLSILHITTSTVYTVINERGYLRYNSTCPNCYKLEHYLLNSTKYFTNNTQMLLLSGIHVLKYNLIIQNVHNISLIGNPTSGTGIFTTDTYAYILIINVSRLTIKHLLFHCTYNIPTFYKWVPLTVKDSSSIVLYHVQLHQTPYRIRYHYALIGINILGNSYFSHVECSFKMKLIYNETKTDMKHHVLSMRNCTANSIQLNMSQDSYKVTLTILDTQIHHLLFEPTSAINDTFIYAEELGANEVLINNCQFVNIIYGEQLLIFNSTKNGNVKFINCQFVDNFNAYSNMYTSAKNIMQFGSHRLVKPSLIKLYLSVKVELID